MPHQRSSPAEIRSQRRFESLRCVAMNALCRRSSAFEQDRVFCSDQMVTTASSASISCHCVGAM